MLAKKGTEKYIAQCWAGLIEGEDAADVVAAERKRRADEARAVEERRRRLRSVDSNLVRAVIERVRAEG
jgi:hypothetical protein